MPLVVTDDDVSGTFTFVRSLTEHGVKADLSAEEIGMTWLNASVEQRCILWWGGNGNSTEHTAWLNLKRGMAAPRSGSIATNGRTVAEQIGAQIFIDGWALVAPGNPQLAAGLAEAAGSVSHDGESVYAAKLLAAMEAEAFLSADIDHLLDVGLPVIPGNSLITRLVADVRAWHSEIPDWRGPLADRALISASDGGYAINDAARIAYDIANLGLQLADLAPLPPPKAGAQFHFTLPGSVKASWPTAILFNPTCSLSSRTRGDPPSPYASRASREGERRRR